MAVEIARRQFDTSDYHKMLEAGILTEDDRVELIEGEIVQMTPIGASHAACVSRLNMLLARQVGDRAIVSVQNPVHLSSRSEPQPDVALLKPRADFYGKNLPGPSDVLLIIEVSDTSLEYDRRIKVPLYARAGIAQVWIVDLAGETIEVYSGPAGEAYSDISQAQRGQSLSLTGIIDTPLRVDDILG